MLDIFLSENHSCNKHEFYNHQKWDTFFYPSVSELLIGLYSKKTVCLDVAPAYLTTSDFAFSLMLYSLWCSFTSLSNNPISQFLFYKYKMSVYFIPHTPQLWLFHNSKPINPHSRKRLNLCRFVYRYRTNIRLVRKSIFLDRPTPQV